MEQEKKQEAIEKADADIRLAQQKREEQLRIDEIEHEQQHLHHAKGSGTYLTYQPDGGIKVYMRCRTISSGGASTNATLIARETWQSS